MIFQEEFRSEDDCVDWLFRTRWPNDFECPKCGGKSIGGLTHEAFINVPPAVIKYPSQPVQFFIKRAFLY
jgi:hypothetical protein